ncbi:TonB-dependent receptor domain-containing protein [Duganella sp. P38]|uniref:TonB-dependent receptor domain-containing protein n=1 Tax=Duganella sp. P38 TaxID=3423949 RepID=UPI003D7A87A4
MTDFTLKRSPLTIALLLAFGAPATVHAQTTSRTAADPDSVPSVVVSASALGVVGDDMITPVTSIGGGELVRLRESTLGETLGSLPGITSSHFGAGASRPVIRGMDGPRVKILSDGAEIQDASTISPDHAVAFEPVLAERIEVLRGPSALAYGGGAVGGVVNILDRKIPSAMPANGLEGGAELRANSAAKERTGAFEFTTGAGNIALHLEGVKRNSDDYRVGKDWSEGRKVQGSYKDSDTGTVGLSWIGQNGYIGAAFTRERTEYGIPGHSHAAHDCHPHGDHLHCGGHEEEEEEGHDHDHDHDHEHEEVPVVKLTSDRWDVRGEYRNPVAGIERVRVRASFTDYVHDELEDGVVATSFRNKGHDGRLEFVQRAAGRLAWRVRPANHPPRFQRDRRGSLCAADADQKHAAFLTEEYRLQDWRFEAGLRHEWQDITVDAPGLRDTDARGTSVSVGAVWKLAPAYSLRASLARSHRLPTAEELYADGAHLATNTYEVGNQNLDKETSNNVDLTLRKFAGDTTFSLSAYHNRVDNYIYAHTLDNHEGFQLVEYAQRDATFTGLEGEVKHKLSSALSATVFGDYVRARFDEGDGSRNLPRIPARRLGAKLDGEWNQWHGMVEFYRVGKQDKVADYETATAGYNMLNLGTHYSTRIGGMPAQFYARLNNVTDKLAYNHTSFIKNAAPLTGRNLTAGVRVMF